MQTQRPGGKADCSLQDMGRVYRWVDIVSFIGVEELPMRISSVVLQQVFRTLIQGQQYPVVRLGPQAKKEADSLYQ